jgi:catechol 1,2-dioxygenase
MSTTNGVNGINGTSKPKPQYDPDFTANVINATGPNASPRVALVLGSLIKHLHDFAREVDLTVPEWMMGVNMINRAGQMSNERRNEGQLLCDVIGLESYVYLLSSISRNKVNSLKRLVDEITNKMLVGAGFEATRTAILGPFFRHDTPPTKNDTSIIKTMPKDGEVTFMHGIVRDAETNEPLKGITVDIWQCSTNGLYEQQDPEQAEFNLRGKLTTDENGYYGLYCLRPVPYPVPDDGQLV